MRQEGKDHDLVEAGLRDVEGGEGGEAVAAEGSGAFDSETKEPNITKDILQNRFGDYARKEYFALKAKFLARFGVGQLRDITMDMLRDLLDPRTSAIGQALMKLIRGDGQTVREERAELTYWLFVRRRLRLQAHGLSSSTTNHRVFAKVFKRVIDGEDGERTACLNHEEYMRLVRNIESEHHYEQTQKHPWQTMEDAVNSSCELFRVSGYSVVVVDDDKVHNENKQGLKSVEIYTSTLGDTKRWGTSIHGSNSAFYRFKLWIKCQRVGETVADCLNVSLLGLVGADSESQVTTLQKFQGKLFLFDRGYTFLPGIAFIVAGGGDAMGTFRQLMAGPFLVDKMPYSITDKRLVLKSRGCRTMLTATCKRPDFLPNISPELALFLKDRLRVCAFFNGRGATTQMFSTLPGTSALYSIEENHLLKRIATVHSSIKGLFPDLARSDNTDEEKARSIELLAALEENEVVCLTRLQGASPLWLYLRITGLTGRSGGHALREQAKRRDRTEAETNSWRVLNGGSDVVAAGDGRVVGDSVDVTDLDFGPHENMFGLIIPPATDPVNVRDKIIEDGDFLEGLTPDLIKQIHGLLPFHDLDLFEADTLVAEMRKDIVKWAKKFDLARPAAQRAAALNMLSKNAMKKLLLSLGVNEVRTTTPPPLVCPESTRSFLIFGRQ